MEGGGPVSRRAAAVKTIPAPPLEQDEVKQVKSKTHEAAESFKHNSVVILLIVALFFTYSLESSAPTLDYWGRNLMLFAQLIHLVATAMYGLKTDWFLVCTLANLAAFTRFWRIEDPNSIIFDEVRSVI